MVDNLYTNVLRRVGALESQMVKYNGQRSATSGCATDERALWCVCTFLGGQLRAQHHQPINGAGLIHEGKLPCNSRRVGTPSYDTLLWRPPLYACVYSLFPKLSSPDVCRCCTLSTRVSDWPTAPALDLEPSLLHLGRCFQNCLVQTQSE